MVQNQNILLQQNQEAFYDPDLACTGANSSNRLRSFKKSHWIGPWASIQKETPSPAMTLAAVSSRSFPPRHPFKHTISPSDWQETFFFFFRMPESRWQTELLGGMCAIQPPLHYSNSASAKLDSDNCAKSQKCQILQQNLTADTPHSLPLGLHPVLPSSTPQHPPAPQ